MGKGKYEESKDQTLKEVPIFNGAYIVRLVSYDGGQPKISIVKQQEWKHAGQWQSGYTSKIGRLNKQCAEAIIKAIQELIDEIPDERPSL